MKIQEYITEKEKKELQLYGIINVLEKFCMPFINHMKRVGIKDWFYRGSNKIGSSKMMKVKSRNDRRPSDMSFDLQKYFDNAFYKKFKWKPRTEGVFVTASKSTSKSYGARCVFFPIGKDYKFIYNPYVVDLHTKTEEFIAPGDDAAKNDMYYDNIRYDWERKYGEDTYGNGSWYYDGKDTGERMWYSAKQKALKQMADKEMEFFDNGLLVWVPDVEWEDYKEQLEKYKGEDEKILIDIVNGYTDKNLKGAHSSGNEIMFKCKEYFLVSDDYMVELYHHFLAGNPMKPDFWQKKFPFEKDFMFKYAVV